MDDLKQSLQHDLALAGFKSEVVPIRHLRDLQSELQTLTSNNDIPKEFYDDQFSDFCFQLPEILPAAKSIIVIASHQPNLILKFHLNGKKIPVVLPSNYPDETDRKFLKIISTFLVKKGYGMCEAVLPVKTLAVHAALAFYGRNNIAYIDKWGSYFRLKAFFSDMPCSSDTWREFVLSDICKKCKACLNQCPTQAICRDRFLIKHERCLTYINESVNDFPEWIEPEWHHCLIGCMVCQDVCPLNKEQKNMSRESYEFSEDETRLLLKGKTRNKLPYHIALKLKKLGILDDYVAIQRNLKALIYKN